METRPVQEKLANGEIVVGQACGVFHTIEYIGSFDINEVGGASYDRIKA